MAVYYSLRVLCLFRTGGRESKEYAGWAVVYRECMLSVSVVYAECMVSVLGVYRKGMGNTRDIRVPGIREVCERHWRSSKQIRRLQPLNTDSVSFCREKFLPDIHFQLKKHHFLFSKRHPSPHSYLKTGAIRIH